MDGIMDGILYERTRAEKAERRLREVEARLARTEDVVLGLEALLAAHRLGSPSRADAALRKLEKARMALADLRVR